MTQPDPAQLSEEGKRLYAQGRFDEAAAVFERAAEGFTLGRAGPLAAEMKNNQSVALLQAGKAELALEAARGTDEVFAGTGDLNRQAMALGNMAAAQEALGRSDEALSSYERAADLFARAGNADLRGTVLKAAAALQLKRGRLTESGLKMLGAMDATERPNVVVRLVRRLLRPRP